jgi:hypothetical protein
MLGVATSTLSRRTDLSSEARGERDQVLAPQEVMRLAAIYRKRSLNDIAQDLIDHARATSAQEAGQVESAVEAFFEGRIISTQEREEFLKLAQRLLPEGLLRDVERSVSKPGEQLPEALVGHPPLPED